MEYEELNPTEEELIRLLRNLRSMHAPSRELKLLALELFYRLIDRHSEL